MGRQPSRVRPRALAPFAVIAIALLALAVSWAANDASAAVDNGGPTDPAPVIIELRVWQHVDDPDNTWLSAREHGGRWDTLGTIPFPIDNHGFSYYEHSFHWFRDLFLAGAELRIWQRYTAPERIFVQTCVTPCPKWLRPFSQINPRLREEVLEASPFTPWVRPDPWTGLGMNPLPLDDGISRDGRYRYGDLTVAVPLGNPGLAADREYLLALRDALAGTASLNWSVGSHTSEWEGVTVSGYPLRVTGLNLAGRGLDGELWGWLGDLTELRELRLEGNRLTGMIPSKLVTLQKLTQVYLAGNEFEGCVPPPLRWAADHDLDGLDLPVCAPPTLLELRYRFPLHEDLHDGSAAQSYRWSTGALGTLTGVLDLPAGLEFRIRQLEPPTSDAEWADCPPYCRKHIPGFDPPNLHVGLLQEDHLPGWYGWNIWLLLFPSGSEVQRSHYLEENATAFEIVERLAASVWINTATRRADVWISP